jgi:hypothetical protein
MLKITEYDGIIGTTEGPEPTNVLDYKASLALYRKHMDVRPHATKTPSEIRHVLMSRLFNRNGDYHWFPPIYELSNDVLNNIIVRVVKDASSIDRHISTIIHAFPPVLSVLVEKICSEMAFVKRGVVNPVFVLFRKITEQRMVVMDNPLTSDMLIDMITLYTVLSAAVAMKINDDFLLISGPQCKLAIPLLRALVAANTVTKDVLTDSHWRISRIRGMKFANGGSILHILSREGIENRAREMKKKFLVLNRGCRDELAERAIAILDDIDEHAATQCTKVLFSEEAMGPLFIDGTFFAVQRDHSHYLSQSKKKSDVVVYQHVSDTSARFKKRIRSFHDRMNDLGLSPDVWVLVKSVFDNHDSHDAILNILQSDDALNTDADGVKAEILEKTIIHPRIYIKDEVYVWTFGVILHYIRCIKSIKHQKASEIAPKKDETEKENKEITTYLTGALGTLKDGLRQDILKQSMIDSIIATISGYRRDRKILNDDNNQKVIEIVAFVKTLMKHLALKNV